MDSTTDSKWLPCVPDLAPYLSQEVADALRVRGKSLPYLHVILESKCEYRHCRHHVFHYPLRKPGFGKNAGVVQEYKETSFTKRICNCMCLLEDPVERREIAETFGIWPSWLQKLEEQALAKMRVQLQE